MNTSTKMRATDEAVASAMRGLEDKINRLARAARLTDMLICDMLQKDENSGLFRVGEDEAEGATYLTLEVSLKAKELLEAFYEAWEGRGCE